MDVNGANNHPLLAWGQTDSDPFIYGEPVDAGELNLPLKIIFSKPYPSSPVMADALFLDGDMVVSKRVRDTLQEQNLYGVDFFPVQIETNKKNVIDGYYLIHIWNEIAAVDKNSYTGSAPNERGRIYSLESFSLDGEVLAKYPEEKRRIFCLSENTGTRLICSAIYELLQSLCPSGFSFCKVSDWDEG